MRKILVLVLAAGCSDYGFGRDVAPGDEPGSDTDTGATGDDTASGDTSDTDPSGEGTDSDTDPTDDTDPDPDTDTGTPDTDTPDIPDDDDCDIAVNTDGWLDQFQTPDDGKVYYCHAGSGNYTMVDSDIDSCLSHLAHEWDVFPSTLCDT